LEGIVAEERVEARLAAILCTERAAALPD